MKRYKYRKVTPKMKEEMQILRDNCMTYEKIAEKFNLSDSTVLYHLSPKVKKGVVDRATKFYYKMTKEEVRKRNKKEQEYRQAYYKERYHNDEEFRRRMITHIINWQKKNKKVINGKKL